MSQDLLLLVSDARKGRVSAVGILKILKAAAVKTKV